MGRLYILHWVILTVWLALAMLDPVYPFANTAQAMSLTADELHAARERVRAAERWHLTANVTYVCFVVAVFLWPLIGRLMYRSRT